MYHLQIIIVDDDGVEQNDADVVDFETLREAYKAQAAAEDAAVNCVEAE